jgi:PIN domain nuclease of toxin-antitoxin system
MRVLLDTHVFIWWDSHPERLSQRALEVCSDPANQLVLSVASVWEMQIKIQLGKLALRIPLADMIRVQREVNKIDVISVELAHVLALEALPALHKDPFDRLIIAQAISTDAAVLTMDPMFRAYDVNLAA